MTIFVNGELVELSDADAALRRTLLREAVHLTVQRYRPALDRLADA